MSYEFFRWTHSSTQRQLGNCRKVNEIIKEASKEFNLTPLYLKQLFKKQTGKNIQQFDKDLRLGKANYLLQTTHKRVKEICFEVGLGYYSHFVRDFQNKYGASPKDIQKRSWLDKGKVSHS